MVSFAGANRYTSPPTTTYEECEKWLLKCHELAPEMGANSLLLGDVYYQQKKYADAKKWYETCAALTPVTEADKRRKAEAEKKAKKC